MGWSDLLDDDVACTAHNPKTFAFDYTAGVLAYKAFVGFDCNTQHSGIVAVDRLLSMSFPAVHLTGPGDNSLCNGSRRGIWLIVRTPVILVNRKLTSRSSAPRCASTLCCSAFSAGEVEPGL